MRVERVVGENDVGDWGVVMGDAEGFLDSGFIEENVDGEVEWAGVRDTDGDVKVASLEGGVGGGWQKMNRDARLRWCSGR